MSTSTSVTVVVIEIRCGRRPSPWPASSPASAAAPGGATPRTYASSRLQCATSRSGDRPNKPAYLGCAVTCDITRSMSMAAEPAVIVGVSGSHRISPKVHTGSGGGESYA